MVLVTPPLMMTNLGERHMKPIDLLFMGPSREVQDNGNGMFTVKITPPAFVGGNGCSLTLTADQFRRYQSWLNDGVLIQNALPELNDTQREMLMTGLNDEEFHDAAGSDQCEACHGTGGLYASHGGVILDQPCTVCGGSGYIEVG
jgi:hypothetical protein